MLGGFKKFLLRGNVVDLAVAVVIGAAFTAVVGAFTEAFLTPLIGLLIGAEGLFTDKFFAVGGTRFPWGQFVNAAFVFTLTAAVVYFFVVLPVNRLQDRFATEADVATPTRECPECLSNIPEAARRCAFCTSELAGGSASGP
ncbi:MAG: large conductance mechanosensitive channel protein MscL [Actinomycetota bacterium]|jgi:large conductance mechanosensitive channel|nr:large conductance mechanosensitive channel protein MscL [Acidothermales bacterium]MDQ3431955.1 large conductance mechanosensitive channel protein MscL [Actinomycetota bacterium]